ncbi:unnamed protein product, partial [Acidithrix sp. C25]
VRQIGSKFTQVWYRRALLNSMPPERNASSIRRPKLGQYELIVRKRYL